MSHIECSWLPFNKEFSEIWGKIKTSALYVDESRAKKISAHSHLVVVAVLADQRDHTMCTKVIALDKDIQISKCIHSILSPCLSKNASMNMNMSTYS